MLGCVPCVCVCVCLSVAYARGAVSVIRTGPYFLLVREGSIVVRRDQVAVVWIKGLRWIFMEKNGPASHFSTATHAKIKREAACVDHLHDLQYQDQDHYPIVACPILTHRVDRVACLPCPFAGRYTPLRTNDQRVHRFTHCLAAFASSSTASTCNNNRWQ